MSYNIYEMDIYKCYYKWTIDKCSNKQWLNFKYSVQTSIDNQYKWRCAYYVRYRSGTSFRMNVGLSTACAIYNTFVNSTGSASGLCGYCAKCNYLSNNTSMIDRNQSDSKRMIFYSSSKSTTSTIMNRGCSLQI